MNRIYTFNAGPSAMPIEVLKKAQEELLCYKESGMSVLEMSHRSKEYDAIIKNTEANIRKLMNIPSNYKVIFMQGGASSQFAMVPLNLMQKNKKADYVVTGSFAKKAAKEASKYGTVHVAASSEDSNFDHIPVMDASMFSDDADYVHITANNTIYGTTVRNMPKTKAPLVADMSSNIMSEKINVEDYGLIYAGAQKNIGPAGLTLVIAREDLLGHAMDITPTMFNYKTIADKDSMYNTPPTFSIYICGLIMEWLLSIGGVEEIEKRNRKKAALLYDFLDQSKLFKPVVTDKASRSMMNVTFVTGDKDMDAKFVAEAAEHQLVGVKGHRSVGGMRASIYNAVPYEAVEALVKFMGEFEKNN